MAATQPALLIDGPPPSDLPASAWQLRAQFGERTWTLPRGTTALGIDERCGLRVEGAGVQAWHCLVTHGARRTIVRRLAPAARLNGNSFTEAELTPGDRLEIGSVELELIEINDLIDRQSAPPTSAAAPAAPSTGPTSQSRTFGQPTTDDECHPAFTARLIQAADERRTLARCARKLGRKARRLEATATALERQWQQRLRRIERDSQAAAQSDRPRPVELTGLAADLAACRTELVELAARQREWLSDRGSLESRLAELAEQAGAGRGLLEQCSQGLSDQLAAIDGLRARCDTHEAAHRQQDDQLAERLTATDARLATLDERVAGLQAEIQRQASDAAGRDDAVANVHISLDARIAELDRELSALAGKFADAAGKAAVDRIEARSAEWSERLDAISARVEAIAATPPQAASVTPESLAQLDAQIVALSEELNALTERGAAAASERQETEGRIADALSQVAALTARIDQKATDLDGRLAGLAEIEPLRARCETLETQVSELRAQQAAMLEERDSWQHEHRRAQEQLAIRSEQIDRKLESLAVQQQAFQSSHDARERDDSHDHIHGHAHRGPMDRLAELQAEREVREQERRRERAEQLLSRHVGGCVPQHHEPLVEAERPSLEDRSAPIEADRHDLPVESPLSATETPVAEPPAIEPSTHDAVRDDLMCQPLSSADASSEGAPADEPRMVVPSARRTHSDEPAATEEPVISVQLPARVAEVLEQIAIQPPPEAQAQRRTPQKPAEQDEHEESIEDYMARLMNRVRGITSTGPDKPRQSEPAAPPPVREEPASSRRAAPVEDRVQPEDVAPPPTEEQPKPVEIRRRPPPERLDLSAMRELANMNARSAIDTHAKKRLGYERKAKLLVAIVSAIVCLALVALGNLGDRMVQAGIAASALAALVFAWRCMKLSGTRGKQPRSDVGGPVAAGRPAETTQAAVAGSPGAAAEDESSV